MRAKVTSLLTGDRFKHPQMVVYCAKTARNTIRLEGFGI